MVVPPLRHIVARRLFHEAPTSFLHRISRITGGPGRPRRGRPGPGSPRPGSPRPGSPRGQPGPGSRRSGPGTIRATGVIRARPESVSCCIGASEPSSPDSGRRRAIPISWMFSPAGWTTPSGPSSGTLATAGATGSRSEEPSPPIRSSSCAIPISWMFSPAGWTTPSGPSSGTLATAGATGSRSEEPSPPIRSSSRAIPISWMFSPAGWTTPSGPSSGTLATAGATGSRSEEPSPPIRSSSAQSQSVGCFRPRAGQRPLVQVLEPWQRLEQLVLARRNHHLRSGRRRRNPNQLDVFARGLDNALWSKFWNPGNGWSNWFSLGGTITSDPVVVAQSQSVGCFRPRAGQRPLVQVLEPWQRLEQLVLARRNHHLRSGRRRRNPNQLDVFARGLDNALWSKFWNPGNGWSGWFSLGGQLT